MLEKSYPYNCKQKQKVKTQFAVSLLAGLNSVISYSLWVVVSNNWHFVWWQAIRCEQSFGLK